MSSTLARSGLLVGLPLFAWLGFAATIAQQAPSGDWPVYAGDQGAGHYSPLASITRANVSGLAVAWEWRPNEDAMPQFGTRPGNFQNTPLMIDGVLYVSTPYNKVVALDADTGKELWSFDPKAYEAGQPPNGTGFVHRGVAAWRDGARLRIFMNSRSKLLSLDAKTGEPVSTFGVNGAVDLTQGLRRPVNPNHYTNTSPPVVYRNLVILGNGVGDRLSYKGDPPGDVRAFDARTGKQVWRFNTIPDPGEVGHDTWSGDSWKVTGHTNVWAPMALDEARGLLYLPVSTPGNDFYGGDRPGANLFGESIVCLDAATGRRTWHFQIVHHGLWDYDPASAPNLVTITVGGRRIDAVVQLTKQGFAFVFDRVTGRAVWPIEERPVPSSDVVREQAWTTQPFPTRPPAIAAQGVGEDDVLDYTPALKSAALAELKKYRTGPLYTPPSQGGTWMRPGIIGGANWGGAAFDPETGVLFVKVSHQAALARIVAPDRSAANPRAGEVDADFVGDVGGGATFTPPPPADAPAGGRVPSLPLFKPPYGEIVAVNLNTGEIAWRSPIGDSPAMRNHPALKGVALPERLGVAGAPGAIVTKGGLVFAGGADTGLNAFDAKTGELVYRLDLGRRTSGTPMTYRSPSGKQMVVIATGAGRDAALVAMAIKTSGVFFTNAKRK
jgi:quinoprotein glucose dehydrogenase